MRLFIALVIAVGLFLPNNGWTTTIYPLETGVLQGFDILVKGAEREVELASSMCAGDFNGDDFPLFWR